MTCLFFSLYFHNYLVAVTDISRRSSCSSICKWREEKEEEMCIKENEKLKTLNWMYESRLLQGVTCEWWRFHLKTKRTHACQQFPLIFDSKLPWYICVILWMVYCHVTVHWCRNTLSFVKWIKSEEKKKNNWTNFWCACIECHFSLDLKWIFMRPTEACVCLCVLAGNAHIPFAYVRKRLFMRSQENAKRSNARTLILFHFYLSFIFPFARARRMHNNEYE